MSASSLQPARRHTVRRVLAALAALGGLGIAASCAQAQAPGVGRPGAGITTPITAFRAASPAPSAREVALNRAIGALQLQLDERLLAADDPGSDWVAGQRARTDIQNRVRLWLAAHRADPHQPLYLASLAAACMNPGLPRPAGCGESDWLAKWAADDRDNGLPWVLLAQRALQRHDRETAIGSLREAAARPRFDDYWGRRAPVLWAVYRPAADPALAALAMGSDLAGNAVDPDPFVLRLCGVAGGAPALAGAAEVCARLGRSIAQHASTAMERTVGAHTAAVNASTVAERREAEALEARVTRQLSACNVGSSRAMQALQSPDAAVRAIAVGIFEQWVIDVAATDELTACERQADRALTQLPAGPRLDAPLHTPGTPDRG